MEISNSDRQRIIDSVNNKWTRPGSCPMCNNQGLSVIPNIFELREYNNGDIIVGGKQGTIPVVPIGCPNCGYTMFINAILAGVIKK